MKDETCPKCDQHPYSETDRHCPVCFDEIQDDIRNCDIENVLESFDDGISNVMDKHIAKNFTSKNGYLFFEDQDILDGYEFAMNILKKLIKSTYKENK